MTYQEDYFQIIFLYEITSFGCFAFLPCFIILKKSHRLKEREQSGLTTNCWISLLVLLFYECFQSHFLFYVDITNPKNSSAGSIYETAIILSSRKLTHMCVTYPALGRCVDIVHFGLWVSKNKKHSDNHLKNFFRERKCFHNLPFYEEK